MVYKQLPAYLLPHLICQLIKATHSLTTITECWQASDTAAFASQNHSPLWRQENCPRLLRCRRIFFIF